MDTSTIKRSQTLPHKVKNITEESKYRTDSQHVCLRMFDVDLKYTTNAAWNQLEPTKNLE